MISPYFFFVVKISLAYMLFFIHIYSDLIISFRNKNEVIDYEIIDKNDEFDKLIDIINKNIWIGYLKKVNIQCKNQEFELYFKELKTWYKIKISLREIGRAHV